MTTESMLSSHSLSHNHNLQDEDILDMIEGLNAESGTEITLTDGEPSLSTNLGMFEEILRDEFTAKEPFLFIQRHLEKLLSASEDIAKGIIGRAKYEYLKKFDQTKLFFNRFKDYFNDKLINDRFDYKSLDQRIQNLFLNISSYRKNRIQQIFSFSESKFNIFISLINKNKHYNNLGGNDIVDYEFLSLLQYINIQKYYHEMPELIILDFIQMNSRTKKHLNFYYLRTLSVMLDDHYIHKLPISNFRNKIILFVQRMIISLTQLKSYDIKKVQKKFIMMKNCESHSSDYLYIILFYLDADIRHKLMSRTDCKKNTENLSNKIKIVCIYLLFNKLLLNKHLTQQMYDHEQIDNFIMILRNKEACINCVMEKCINILSDKEMNYLDSSN